jgi:glycogen debranching enzyme
MKFEFTNNELADFSGNIRKEWAITNGIGGYAGSSVLGAHNRTHQGYLIASLHPPVERYVVFSKTNERFWQGGILYDLETSQHLGTGAAPRRADGNRYLRRFTYDGTVTFSYAAGALSFEKHIAMVQGKNETVLAYDFQNDGADAVFTITPLMNFREHSASSTPDSLKFRTETSAYSFTLIPDSCPRLRIELMFSDGTLSPRGEQFDVDMQYQTEVDNETDGLDCHFTPYDITFRIPAHSRKHVSLICRVVHSRKHVSLICRVVTTGSNRVADGDAVTVGDGFVAGADTVTVGNGFVAGGDTLTADSAFLAYEQARAHIQELLALAGYGDDDFANTLVVAANQFLAYRTSTGLKTVLAGLPWFTDWGRDTMIAFTGLTLCTHRYREAEQILKTFAMYVHHGLVPNMFPDDGQAPLYNTADASLWYFYAVDQYLRYVDTAEARAFIRREIYPSLKEILSAYQNGTDFSIYMDTDGLIHAGSGLDQVTWMDVRVGDWVVTPRHGKPVEINALWYNALCVMEQLAVSFGEDAVAYRALAEQVKASFCEKFWYADGGYLYDVIDGDERDSSLRPNQIYAVSLPYTMLPPEQAASVVEVVARELYAGPGLRSLAPDHPDYHPVYLGALPKRDAAYHQGTAWGFLMGGFITAYTKVHNHSESSIRQALEYLAPVREQFYDGGIGTISEIFDGDDPHHCRGCYAQAWSVGEVLRCYTEDILPYI